MSAKARPSSIVPLWHFGHRDMKVTNPDDQPLIKENVLVWLPILGLSVNGELVLFLWASKEATPDSGQGWREHNSKMDRK